MAKTLYERASTANEQRGDALKQRLHIVKEDVKRTKAFSRIEDAIAAMRAGRMVIVVDDEDCENEGDLTLAAEKITPEAINFMAQYGRGLICLAMAPDRLDALQIPLMVSQNSSRFETEMGRMYSCQFTPKALRAMFYILGAVTAEHSSTRLYAELWQMAAGAFFTSTRRVEKLA